MDLQNDKTGGGLKLAEIPPFVPKEAKVPGKVTKIPSLMRLSPLSPPHVPRPPPPRPPAPRPRPKPPQPMISPRDHGATPEKDRAKGGSRRWSVVAKEVLLDNILALSKKRSKNQDPLLHALSMNHDLIELEDEDKNKKWYNRTGVKRKLIALGIVAFLLLSTTFLLRKEVTLEETAQSLKKTQVSNRRKISAVIGIELGLLVANGFAAHRAVKIASAWRRARIGDIVSKTKATINVITHPPPFLRPLLAPIQLVIKHTRPLMKVANKVNGKIKERAERAAAKFEKRRLYFINEAAPPINQNI